MSFDYWIVVKWPFAWFKRSFSTITSHFLKCCNGLHSLEEIEEVTCLSRTMSGLPLGVEDHYYGLRPWIKVTSM